MTRQLISYDPLNNVSCWWDGDQSLIINEQHNINALQEWNRLEFNDNDRDYGVLKGQNRWGTRVARINMLTYLEWIKEGKHKDQAWIKRWLNDPTNRGARTHESRL